MTEMTYPARIPLIVDGEEIADTQGTLPVRNPATGEVIGELCMADTGILDRALAAADRTFVAWSRTSPLERSTIIRRAAGLLRERADAIGHVMTMEQGKTLKESRGEAMVAAEILEWFAEEARRTYGRIVPARTHGVVQLVERVPVGPVAAFTPWNFPLNQIVRKIGPALAAGCSVVAKGPEETPASVLALVRIFHEAGLPAGVLNIVYGSPAEISSYLIPHPVIRKVSFTGSTAVGKQLASLAGSHMKRVTMELGGHGPAMVFDDADVEASVAALAAVKFRNAGQVCIAPTRFIVQDGVHDRFVNSLTCRAQALRVGDGLDPESDMGPLANPRRVNAMEEMVADAVSKGATVRCGGKRIGNRGNFFEPTVLCDVTPEMRAMNEEPFGPIALVSRFRHIDDAIAEANRLPYGLAAYVWSASRETLAAVEDRVRSGMLTVNHHGIGPIETPFGGTKDSGFGSEGGAEAMDGYLETRFVSRAA